MRVLITGSAGFIGNALTLKLLDEGHQVIGVDNLNPYYEVTLKEARLERVKNHCAFREARVSIEDRAAIEHIFEENRPEAVIHLAAQVGVRHAFKAPHDYVQSNLVGFMNVLDGCREHKIGHLVYASSSSVYGANSRMPFSEHDSANHPLSLYAATKKSNEMMAHAYSNMHDLPVTGLRFFTVYGPWGRPDMALFKFTRAILAGEPIRIFNLGKMKRDFIYIDDIVDGISKVAVQPARPSNGWSADHPDPAISGNPYRIYNIGNHSSVGLDRFVDILEEAIGKKAIREYHPIQPGEVVDTYAQVSDIERDFGFKASIKLEEGIPRFVKWYREFYGQ